MSQPERCPNCNECHNQPERCPNCNEECHNQKSPAHYPAPQMRSKCVCTVHWVRSVCVRKCDQYVFTAAIEMSQSTLQRALSGTTDATKMCLHLCSPSEERTDHKTCAVQTSKVEVTKRCNQNEERADHKTCVAQTRTCKPQNLCSPNE